jgi:hypothetical protein
MDQGFEVAESDSIQSLFVSMHGGLCGEVNGAEVLVKASTSLVPLSLCLCSTRNSYEFLSLESDSVESRLCRPPFVGTFCTHLSRTLFINVLEVVCMRHAPSVT